MAGRPLDRIIGIAKAAGYLKGFPETIDHETAMRLPPGEVMIVATGGQGEANAALGRIAAGNHIIKLAEGDLVLFSSKQIPGNEVAIGRIQNSSPRNVPIVTRSRRRPVSASGAASCAVTNGLGREPDPGHGERRHLDSRRALHWRKGCPVHSSVERRCRAARA